MYSKYKIKKLLDKYEHKLKKGLGIKAKITWHIYDSRTKKSQVKTMVKSHNCYGISFINAVNNADIVIYNDLHFTERQVISTIIHELLHIRMYAISGLVTINLTKMNTREERLVRDLESLLINLFWDGKL